MAAADAIAASKERIASLLEPISGGVGEDVSYDERFDAVKNEVEKLQSISGGKVDWGSVASGADELLADKSKDFRVAVYYATAKAHLDGPEGLLDGLVLVHELSNAFWEAMYPALRRPKARGNLVGWFGDVVAPQIEAFSPTPRHAELAQALDEVSRNLDAFLRDKLADAYPGLGALRQAIRALVSRVPREPTPPPPPPPRAEHDTDSTALAQATSDAFAAPSAVELPSAGAIESSDDALRAMGECGLVLVRAAETLRYADPADPQAYRVLRAGLWVAVAQSPMADGGQTFVPPPELGLRERLEALAGASNWLALIHAGEEIAAGHVLWLDPHRYVCAAMDQLGVAYEAAKAAILREVASLVARAPDLPNLTFNDGTPMADEETRAWLESEVASAGGAGAANGAGARPRGSSIDRAIQDARQAASGGDLVGAIASLTKAIASASAPAERFKGKLGLARICLDAQHFMIARAQLEGLDRVADHHKLAEWDPGLCAELYGALFAAHRAANQGIDAGPDAYARQNAAFERLCQLDASAAIRLMSEA